MAESSPAGSGRAPVPVAPEDGALRIRGGVGGLSFQFEELLSGAAALDGIVRELAAVEAEADGVRRALFPYQSDAYSSGSHAIVAVGEGARALRRVRTELEGLASEVRASHREYEFTEARNALLLRIGRTGPAYGPLWGLFGLPPVTVRDTVEDAVALAPARLALLLGLPAGLAVFGGTGGRSAGRDPWIGGRAGTGFSPSPAGPDRRQGNPDGGGRRLTLRVAAAGGGRRPEQRGDRGPTAGGARQPSVGGRSFPARSWTDCRRAPTLSTPAASPKGSATTRRRPPLPSAGP